jgi:hypothetical protein
MAEYEYEKREVPSSSLTLAQGDAPRTTNDGSPRLRAAIRKLPAELGPDELAEASAILASWPDAAVLSQLNRLLAQARTKDIPHIWLMGCLRRRKAARPHANPNAEPDGEPPAVAGRIDPVLTTMRDAERQAALDRADVDAILAPLDDRQLAILHRRVVAESGAHHLAGLNPRRSHLLRSLLANALAPGRAAADDSSVGASSPRVAHAATP